MYRDWVLVIMMATIVVACWTMGFTMGWIVWGQ
jgi:hypothetical protein